MRRSLRRLAAGTALAVIAAGGLAMASTTAARADDDSTELVVSFKSGTSSSTQDAVSEDAGDVVQEIPQVRARTIQVPRGRADAVRRKLLKRGDVSTVEDDTTMTASLLPNDPAATGPAAWSLAKVKLPAAWDVTTGSSSILVAVVDTGLTPTSPELPPAKLVPGRNVIRANDKTADDNGHGTMAASVALMVGGNGAGGAGACWACRVMPVKVLGSNGSGSASDVAAGITWAVDHGADVISLSLGGGGITALKNAVQYAEANGVPVVAAAGNNSSSVLQYPAGYPTAISVGATDQNDNRASYSNYGSWVRLAAPGTSEAMQRTGVIKPDYTGTSAATPLVSGTVGLMLTEDPALTPAQIRSILMSTADPAGIPLAPGTGRLDAAEAVAQAQQLGSGTTTSTTSTSTTSTSTTSTSTTSTSTTSSSTTSTTVGTGTPTTVTGGGFTFGGTVSKQVAVKAGAVTFSARCSFCLAERLDVLNTSGQVVATLMTGVDGTVTADLPAGTYTFRVTSNAFATISYSITYLK